LVGALALGLPKREVLTRSCRKPRSGVGAECSVLGFRVQCLALRVYGSVSSVRVQCFVFYV